MTASDDPEDKATDGADYEVGYGRPPKATRFAPGRSGNPRGRPKTPKNFAEAFERRLSAKVAVTENGRRKLVSYREVIVGQIVRKAAEGDIKHSSLVLKSCAVPPDHSASETANLPRDPQAEEALLRQIISSMDVPLDVLLNLPPESDHDET